jgi:beta-lactam-binding protein with PASTA domain
MADGGHTHNGFLRFVLSRAFWVNLLLIAIFFGICFGLTFIWLNSYTRHNQQLELPDYRGIFLDTASSDAEARTFRMHVLDSIYVVGKRGHEIIQQNPPPGSLVKENRTIYVTITKKSVDKVPVSRLPILYGKDYGRKKRELYQSYQIESEVVGRRFDPGEPDHILEVR